MLPVEIWQAIVWTQHAYTGNGGCTAVPQHAKYHVDFHDHTRGYRPPIPHEPGRYHYIEYHIDLEEHLALARTSRRLYRAIGSHLHLVQHALSCLATQRSPVDQLLSEDRLFQLTDRLCRPVPLATFVTVHRTDFPQHDIVLTLMSEAHVSQRSTASRLPVMCFTGSRVVGHIASMLHKTDPTCFPDPGDLLAATQTSDVDIFTAAQYHGIYPDVQTSVEAQFSAMAEYLCDRENAAPTLTVRGSGTICKITTSRSPTIDVISPAMQPHNVVIPGLTHAPRNPSDLLRASLLHQTSRFHSSVVQCCALPDKYGDPEYYISPLCLYTVMTRCNIPMGYTDAHAPYGQHSRPWQDMCEMTSEYFQKWSKRGFEHLPQPIAYPSAYTSDIPMACRVVLRDVMGPLHEEVLVTPRLFSGRSSQHETLLLPQYMHPSPKCTEHAYARLMLRIAHPEYCLGTQAAPIAQWMVNAFQSRMYLSAGDRNRHQFIPNPRV